MEIIKSIDFFRVPFHVYIKIPRNTCEDFLIILYLFQISVLRRQIAELQQKNAETNILSKSVSKI